MIKLVSPSMKVFMEGLTSSFVLVSTELMASSRISSGASAIIALAMVTSCRSPAERTAMSTAINLTPAAATAPAGSDSEQGASARWPDVRLFPPCLSHPTLFQ